MDDDTLSRAHALRRQVLGEAYADKAAASQDAFNRPFQQYAVENVYGRTWLSGVLTLRELTLINIAMLAAMGRMEEVELYIRSGLLRTGVPLEAIREVLMHVTVYCGVPVGREVFLIAKRVLTSEGIDPSILDQSGGAGAGAAPA